MYHRRYSRPLQPLAQCGSFRKCKQKNEMKRKAEFDILKGILIVFVVIGHVVDVHTTLHKIIFGFHMPAFFYGSRVFSASSGGCSVV